MKVPFLDLKRLHCSLAGDLHAALDSVLAESAFILGGPVAAFEGEFAAAHGQAGAAGCGSGTDALALALRASGIGPGDEVVVPSMTFVATAEAVVHVGATPVLADVDPTTLLLTAETVASVRSDHTRAVVPVHLYGHVVPFSILAAWRASGLLVIEDAAQAHLATWGGEFVGSRGDAACFSFYPGKNLGALGDAGAVLSSNSALLDEVRRLRDHGRHSKFEHQVMGYCSRLDGLQAAFLRAKLQHLAGWTEDRRNLADRYQEQLAGHLVPWAEGAVHHLLVARVPSEHRDRIRARLHGDGVATGIHYPVPLSLQPSCAPWASPCPAAEVAAEEVVSLPIDPLMTMSEVDYVADRFTAHISALS